METIETLTPDSLIAGDHPTIQEAQTVASGSGALTRGTVLGMVTASGKLAPYAAANVDGTAEPVAILDRDIDATSADVKTMPYVHGQFNEDKLTGLDAAGKNKLRARAIYCAKVY